MLGVRYQFKAATQRFEPPAARFDPDRSDFTNYPNRYRLYDVTLVLALGAQRREFVYQELAWQSPARP